MLTALSNDLFHAIAAMTYFLVYIDATAVAADFLVNDFSSGVGVVNALADHMASHGSAGCVQ
jgi:hypothetical protein